MFFEISEREIFKCISLFKEKFSEDFNIVKKIKEMLDLVDFFIFKFLEFLGILKLNGGWFFGLYLVSFLIFLFQLNMEYYLVFNLFFFMDGKFFFLQEVEKDYLKCQYCERTFRRQKNLENYIENIY